MEVALEGRPVAAAMGEPGKPMQVQLARLAKVTGRLVHEGGAPAKQYLCFAAVPSGGPDTADGRFDCWVAADAKTLEIEADQERVVLQVKPKEGRTFEAGVVEIPRVPRGAVRGQVVFEGKPLAGVAVRKIEDLRPSEPAVTDAQGRFALEKLPVGAWTVRVQDGGYLAKARASVKAGDARLSLSEETVTLESQPPGLHSFKATCRSQVSDQVGIVLKPGEVAQVVLEVR